MIKIDKGVPIPTVETTRKRIYPWDDMEVNDSFLLPRTYTKEAGSSLIHTTQKRANRTAKFKCAMTDEGVRVWRVS